MSENDLTGIFHEDNLDLLRRMPSGCVDLAYCDPPFNTGKVQKMNRIKLGQGSQMRGGFLGRSYSYEVTTRHSYRDDMPLEEYLDFLAERLVEIHRVLKPTGSLYLHLDWNVVHYARFMLDEIFGPDNFLNEIIWSYDYGGRARDKWARKHDNILWYRKGKTHTYNRDAIDRIPYMAPELVGPEKAALGKLPTDVWWMTIVPTNGKERTGYPTQKPLKLVERIVRASSNPGDLVADFFIGSGTAAVAAAKLGRRYVGCDVSPDAIRITKERLAGVQPTLEDAACLPGIAL
ncbi:DNA-methyltransferase [Geodermatophilus sp. SYSU D01106]